VLSDVIPQSLHKQRPKIAHLFQPDLDRVNGRNVSTQKSVELLLVTGKHLSHDRIDLMG
jgi:hypothetical protein